MIKLVIFDLDGTLLNTIDDLAAAGNHVCAAHGWPTHTSEQFRYFVGDGVYKLIERMTPAGAAETPETVQCLRDEFNAYYNSHSCDLTVSYTGVPELLKKLDARGIAAAVLSNKPDTFTQQLCANLLGGRFAVVHGQREGRPTKPDESLTREILLQTCVRPDECIYVGDSGVDMRTAKNGGLFAVGALWGFRTRKELLENGADALADSPLDVLEYIG